MKEPERPTQIRIGQEKHKYEYYWSFEYNVWIGTRAMDGARQDSKMLVIVPGADESHIAVNIQKDAVKSSEKFWNAVAQGKQVLRAIRISQMGGFTNGLRNKSYGTELRNGRIRSGSITRRSNKLSP